MRGFGFASGDTVILSGSAPIADESIVPGITVTLNSGMNKGLNEESREQSNMIANIYDQMPVKGP